MSKVEMLVGLPGCGKSTYAQKKAKQGWCWLSSDNIRKDYHISGYTKEDHAVVFGILHSNIKALLANGYNCIYDATNLSRKNRIAFLSGLNQDVEKKCVLFVTPIDECKRRNGQRIGSDKVPEETYDKMIRQFQVPNYYEGWDEIEIVNDTKGYICPWNEKELESFDQDNPHHFFSLGKHMRMVAEKLRFEGRKLIIAGAYHDIGKLITKTYINNKGKKLDHASYYGHENAGAYLFLTDMVHNLSDIIHNHAEFIANKTEILYIVDLINWHMAPYTKWQSEKSKERDKKLIGEQMFADIMKLHAADVSAH